MTNYVIGKNKTLIPSYDAETIEQISGYFIGEWADGNPNGEDRTGRFVTSSSSGNKIELANADSYISGVSEAYEGDTSKARVNPIGLTIVQDDGVLSVGDKCMPTTNGKAKKSSNTLGYRVVARIDSTHVQIIVSPNNDMVQRIKTHDDIQDDVIADAQSKLYEVNDGETTINGDGGAIRNLFIYGKSVQNGTPTPDNPIDIQSVVNPKIEVCGKNLWSLGDIQTETGSEIKIYIPKGTYTFSRKETSNNIAFRFFTTQSMSNKNSFLFYLESGIASKKISFSTDIYGLNYNVTGGFTAENEMQIELGSIATYFEPYKGNQATLPYTLNAIPVSSGGNVTIDGQEYIADYVDIENKKLHRLLKKVNVLDLSLKDYGVGGGGHDFLAILEKYDRETQITRVIPSACTKFANGSYKQSIDINDFMYKTNSSGWDGMSRMMFRVPSEINTLDLFNQYVGNDCYVIYQLKEPTTIDITDEEVEAFKNLRTYEGVTNIINSSDEVSGKSIFIYNIASGIDSLYEQNHAQYLDIANAKSSISNEVTERKNADTTLQNSINSVNTTLQNSINSVDENLRNSINSVNSNLQTNINAKQNKVLYGTSVPTSSQGSDGDIYIMIE